MSIVMTAPVVDYKIHWLKMMSVPESRAIVGKHDGINGRDSLVNDEESCQWLDSAYKLRNMYLHILEDPKATISFVDLARARLSVVRAIDAYLDLTSLYADLNRTALLRSLNVKQAV